MSCIICYSPYSYEEQHIPRILTCGHTFCTSCIQNLLTVHAKRPFQCPNCRVEQRRLGKIDSYPKNFSLLEEVVNKPISSSSSPSPGSVGLILDCCDSSNSSDMMPMNTQPQVVSVMCPQHPQKPYEFYDTICSKFVCGHCIALGDHVGHRCITLEAYHSSCQQHFGEIKQFIPVFISSIVQGVDYTTKRIQLLDTNYSTKHLEIENFSRIYLSDQPGRGEELLLELKDLYLNQMERLRTHNRKLNEIKESMSTLYTICCDLHRDDQVSSSNPCFLSILDQLNCSFVEVKKNYHALKSFFARSSNDYDWSAKELGLRRNEFAVPGDPRIEFIPLIGPNSPPDAIVHGPITGTWCHSLFQISLSGDDRSFKLLQVMSDNGSFFATGYYLLALALCPSSTNEMKAAARDLAGPLIPVLENKRRLNTLTKDEAFIFSKIYENGICCERNDSEANYLSKLSNDLVAEFRQEPEMKSREKLISLHLQLLDHSVKCTVCPSKNCKKMKDFITHLQTCPIGLNGRCVHCRRVTNLLKIHSLRCVNPSCTVPNCKFSTRVNNNQCLT